VREYLADGVALDQVTGERRRMECTDCHNRPSHAIAATPERAVNEAMARGSVDFRSAAEGSIHGGTCRQARRRLVRNT